LFLDYEDDTELNNCHMNGILFDEIYTVEGIYTDEIYTVEVEVLSPLPLRGETSCDNLLEFLDQPWTYSARHHRYQGLCRFMYMLIGETMLQLC